MWTNPFALPLSMDRTNIGNAKVAGMEDDLSLTSNQYSAAILVFQVAYVVFGVPSNMILPRVRPSLYIPFIMILWGTVVACMAAIQNAGQLHALRFLLGITEAGFSPAVLFMLSMWYRRNEQSKRFMIFWTAGILSGAFAGILAGAIASSLDGRYGIAGWRWLFLVEGVVTVGLAFVAPFFLLDFPTTCKKFSETERRLAIRRLQADGIISTRNAENEKRMGHLRALKISFLTPRIWVIFLAYVSVVGSYAIQYFYPTLVEGLGYSSVDAQFMTVPLYVVVLPVSITLCIFANKTPGYRAIYLGAVLVFGAVFFALSAGILAYVPRYVFLCFINIAIWSANPLALSFATTTFGSMEPEVRAICLAIMNGFGNLAQVYGGYLLPDSDAPRYLKGFATYACILTVGASLYVTAHFVFRWKPLKAQT